MTAFGASGIVDQAVKRISRTYEVRGMLETITSYDKVEMEYNDFGQLITESEEHAGTVSGSTPNVQYAYASGGSSSNQIRPTTLTYPDGYAISYDYGTPASTATLGVA